MRIEKRGEFAKVKDGVIYGWAVVSTQKNVDGVFEPYVDLHGDYIPDSTLPGVAAEFMSTARIGKDMHAGDQIADVVFCLPVTEDIAKALGLETDRTGLVIGWRPYDKTLLDAVANGTRLGFSIGGYLTDAEEKRVAKDVGTEKANKHKRTFRSWKLAEISLVDVPAQEGALVGIVKRGPLASIAKACLYTTEVDGHAHTISFYDDGTMWTSYATSAGAENGHSHSVMRDAEGKVVILADSGHTHDLASDQPGLVIVAPETIVVVQARSPSAEATPAQQPAIKSTPSINPSKVEPMKIVVLSEAHKAYYDKLFGPDAEAFIAKSAADRESEVQKALAADPVVYKTDSGIEVRKSHGDIALMLAKQSDENARQVAKANELAQTEKAAREAVELQKRATTTIGSLAGSDSAHCALMKAAESIADEKLRDEAIATLKAANAVMATKGRAPGVGGAEPPDGATAQEQFDTMTLEYAQKNNVDRPTARVAVMKTAEGKRLYAESIRS